ncbi:MAG: PaaX family transcriptional regulator, partial [Proteobacteria bacterium]|nr:PaaX family transcriptional regulator [Pseudomonadota bacterium]
MKPSGVILDLLRTYQQQGTSARNIMATGKMFGFNENAMRVNLSRLASRQIIE